MAPPEANKDVSNWQEEYETSPEPVQADDSQVDSSPELDALRQRLEGLL